MTLVARFLSSGCRGPYTRVIQSGYSSDLRWCLGTRHILSDSSVRGTTSRKNVVTCLFQRRMFSSSSPFRHTSNGAPSRHSSTDSDIETDVLIVGTGAAALTASLRAHSRGLRPLVIEKTALIGGTTAYSGGGVWIPNSGVPSESSKSKGGATADDSFEEAFTYLKSTIDRHPQTRASTPARKTAFLKEGPKMVGFLKEQGFNWVPSVGYPDYYPSLPGGKSGGRGIEGEMVDFHSLPKEWREKVRVSPMVPKIPMYTYEAGTLIRAASSWAGFQMMVKIVFGRMLGLRMLGKEMVAMGLGLVVQLLRLNIQRNIPIWTDTKLIELIVEDGNVTAALVEKKDKSTMVIKARHGIILAAGGFSRNKAMRQQYQTRFAAASNTLTSPDDTGDAISAAMRIGAATELMEEAWWGPTTLDPVTGEVHWCHFERPLPHCIIVDKTGQRFTNEAQSYTSIIHDQFKRNEKVEAIPAYMILDHQHRSKYLLAGLFPGKVRKSALQGGLITQADTIQELAQKLGIDENGLENTISQFNTFSRSGIDTDFNRGSTSYDRFFGDPKTLPNPNLGAIEKPPFYAARIWPGDLGTKGGIVTDEFARALREDGSVIGGLFAVGNSSAAVMGREYIGSGSTLGPAMTFAFVAGSYVGRNRMEERKVS